MVHAKDNFHVNKPQDSSGFELILPQDVNRFKYARNGDHIMTPFQCDVCIFFMLKGRAPIPNDHHDVLLQIAIRRVILDSFWSREPSTVDRNRQSFNKMVDVLKRVNVDPQVAPLGPFPKHDIMGISVAIAVVLRSLDPGKYANYSQYDTIRKLRSAHANQYMASVSGCNSMVSIGKAKSKQMLSHCPTQSLWYERFSFGCLKRMGQIVKQDLAISIEVMLELINQFTRDIQMANEQDKFNLVLAATYSVIAFCGSFRGNEVFLVELDGLKRYYEEEKDKDHVIIPLLGRFKGETGERHHLTPLAAVTRSGIQVKSWVEMLLSYHEKIGRNHGPVFCDRWGNPMKSAFMQSIILDALMRLQQRCPHVIPSNVDVQEEYGISRSFRRGATTHARNQGVSASDIDAANRWRNAENAQGRKISQPMRDHYVDVRQMLPTLLRFSQAL